MKRSLRPVLIYPPHDILSQAIKLLPELRPDVSEEWFDFFDLDSRNCDHRELLLLIFQAIALGTSQKGRKKGTDEGAPWGTGKWARLGISVDASRIISDYPDGNFNKTQLAEKIKNALPQKYRRIEVPSIKRKIFEDLRQWSQMSKNDKARLKNLIRRVRDDEI